MTYQIGDTVTGVKCGGKNRQTFVVGNLHRNDAGEVEIVTGSIVSKKHPGDFRGGIACYVDTVRPA